MKKLIGFLFIFYCTPSVVWAQRKSAPKETIIQAPSSSNRSKVISKNNDARVKNINPTGTLALGISTSTSSGIFGGITARKVWINNPKIQSLFGLDLSIIKDYKEKLFHYISILLEHTRTFLTTRNMATYVFDIGGIPIHPENEILFLSANVFVWSIQFVCFIGSIA
jgi:hypothetical protein